MSTREAQFKLKGFDIVRFDRIFSKGGGLALCVKSGINFEIVDLNFNNKSLEVGSIVIGSNLGEILITLCYRSPTGNNNLSQMEW